MKDHDGNDTSISYSFSQNSLFFIVEDITLMMIFTVHFRNFYIITRSDVNSAKNLHYTVNIHGIEIERQRKIEEEHRITEKWGRIEQQGLIEERETIGERIRKVG